MKFFLELTYHEFGEDNSVRLYISRYTLIDSTKELNRKLLWKDKVLSFYDCYNFEKILQKILKEPLKFMKDPLYSFLALEVLKEPSLEIYLRFENFIKPEDAFKITKKELKSITMEDYSIDFRSFYNTDKVL